MLPKDYRAILDENLSLEITTILSSLLSRYDEMITKQTDEYFTLFPVSEKEDIISIDENIYFAQMLEEFIANIPTIISRISRNYSEQFCDEL